MHVSVKPRVFGIGKHLQSSPVLEGKVYTKVMTLFDGKPTNIRFG